ncbi:MAG: nitrilase-related carbon-nitrogen hydrolase, partial [Myxococcota bacterium]
MKVAIAQYAPTLLDRSATLERVNVAVEEAANEGARLVAFAETFVPGYPIWLDQTDASRFDDDLQKDIHARYLEHAVCLAEGHLDTLCGLAKAKNIGVVLGIAERDAARGQSLFATAISIDATGHIAAQHRKLVPTYEERLAWSHGDAHGLRTWPLDE